MAVETSSDIALCSLRNETTQIRNQIMLGLNSDFLSERCMSTHNDDGVFIFISIILLGHAIKIYVLHKIFRSQNSKSHINI